MYSVCQKGGDMEVYSSVGLIEGTLFLFISKEETWRFTEVLA